jgi:hypothetical protein
MSSYCLLVRWPNGRGETIRIPPLECQSGIPSIIIGLGAMDRSPVSIYAPEGQLIAELVVRGNMVPEWMVSRIENAAPTTPRSVRPNGAAPSTVALSELDQHLVSALSSMMLAMKRLRRLSGRMLADNRIWTEHHCADGYVDTARQLLTTIVCDAWFITHSEADAVDLTIPDRVLCPECAGTGKGLTEFNRLALTDPAVAIVATTAELCPACAGTGYKTPQPASAVSSDPGC